MSVDLSIIVPRYNEEQNVEPLYKVIIDVIDPLEIPYEMLFVDDGSRDSTVVKASRLAEKDHRLRVIKFILVIKTLLKFSMKPMHLFAAGGLVSMAFGGVVLLRVLDGFLRDGWC